MWEVALLKNSSCSLKERLARNTLERIRSQGHPYVELREDGKRYVFFCTLCLSPCYSDNALLDHLRGALHNRRLSVAKLTLLKPNPWPFNDGVNFFDCSSDAVVNSKQLAILNANGQPRSLAIVEYHENELNTSKNAREAHDLVVPSVLIMDGVSDLKVRFIGMGRIAARFREIERGETELLRLWCEWLGVDDNNEVSEEKVLDHDFAVVTFSYNFQLGNGTLDDLKMLVSSEMENDRKRKKRRTSFSDPGHMSESAGFQSDSSGEEVSSSSYQCMGQDPSFSPKCLTRKTIRREMRQQQRVAADRMCDICQQRMLPEKDAAALLNMKTGKLVCSSRNENGAFHVFHASCLLHWILLSESEIVRNQVASPKVKRVRKKKCASTAKGGKSEVIKPQISSVFCPECQGTGINIKGIDFEIPTFPLSEIFKFKIKMSDGRRGWMKSPEVLDHCSTGFCFSSKTKGADDAQEKVVRLKVMHFYRAVGL